jgi:hypothetical protein
LLYSETAPEQLTTLEGIEFAVRGHILEHVSPEIGHFLLQQPAKPTVDGNGRSNASLEKSASAKTKQNATVSYERCAQDIPVLTGIGVSRGTQHRLGHRQPFALPVVEKSVEELSIDGGKVRLRTPKAEICRWQDYKAVNLHGHCCEAFLQENQTLVDWANGQPLATPVVCLGDGHDGIWNLFAHMATHPQRQEILDWFHLVENLNKVGGSSQRLATVEALLWKGDVDGAIAQFKDWQHERVDNFIAYLNKHRHRIINYSYFQAEGISISSGSMESTVKQIGARIKLSGAQWKVDNVPQVLLHRCAYLNGQFSN